MTPLYCCICEEMICKYRMDLRPCGGMQFHYNEKEKFICERCAKEIAKELIER